MSRGRPFEPGNKFGRGRPKGSRNRAISPARRLLLQHAEALTAKNIAEGMKTDTKARIWSLNEVNRITSRVLKLKLPPIQTLGGIAQAMELAVKAFATGKCTAADGQALCAMLATQGKILEIQEFVPRLEKLEALLKQQGTE
jgi:hypothetical protein